jgi:hypothetical protein
MEGTNPLAVTETISPLATWEVAPHLVATAETRLKIMEISLPPAMATTSPLETWVGIHPEEDMGVISPLETTEGTSLRVTKAVTSRQAKVAY